MFTSVFSELGISTAEMYQEVFSTKLNLEKLPMLDHLDDGQISRLKSLTEMAQSCGIGWSGIQLLESAGINDLPDLAWQNPLDLYSRVIAINIENKVANQVPSYEAIKSWIREAIMHPRVQCLANY
jgi:hypothetical protein